MNMYMTSRITIVMTLIAVSIAHAAHHDEEFNRALALEQYQNAAREHQMPALIDRMRQQEKRLKQNAVLHLLMRPFVYTKCSF